MENIPEADYEIIPHGTIRTVPLTRLSNSNSYLPSAKRCKIETIYGIKDTNYEREQIRFWRLRFYRSEYEGFTLYEMIIVFFKSFLICMFLKMTIKNIYSFVFIKV